MGENTFNSVVARNIRYLLSQTDMSDNDLARASNISKSTLSRILNSEYKKDIDRSYIVAVAAALEVDEEVLTEENTEILLQIEKLERLVSGSVVILDEMVRQSDELLCMTEKRGIRERSRALKVRGMIEYQLGRNSAALAFYEEAYQVAKLGGEPEIKIQVAKNKCEALYMLGMFDELENTINTEMPYISDQDIRARMIYILGSAYYKREEYQSAKEYFELCLHLIPDSTNTKIFQARCLQTLGGTYQKLGDLEKARNYSVLACNKADDCEDQLTKLYALQVLGDIEREFCNTNDAIKKYQESLDLAKVIGRQYEIISLEYSIAYMQKSLNDIKEILDKTTEIEMPPRDLVDMCTQAARLAFEENEYVMGQTFYERALKTIQKSRYNEMLGGE